jgi:hypothetical protein
VGPVREGTAFLGGDVPVPIAAAINPGTFVRGRVSISDRSGRNFAPARLVSSWD